MQQKVIWGSEKRVKLRENRGCVVILMETEDSIRDPSSCCSTQLEDQSYGVLYVQFWRQFQRCIWPITNVFIIRQRSECWLPSVDINGSQHSSFSGDFECPGKRSETGVWRSQRAHLWTPHAVRILMTPTATKFIFRSLCSAEHSVMKNCDM